MEETAEPKSNGYGKKPLWLWIVIYLVIGGIAYAAIYYLFLAKNGGYNPTQSTQYQAQPTTAMQPSPTIAEATSSPSAEQSRNIITLGVNGFSPATLTIKSGQAVEWTNKSGDTATVNSDPHPVHTAYPPLNLGSFPDGGTLTLTFDKPGTYGYHNHLNPSEKGTIIVVQ